MKIAYFTESLPPKTDGVAKSLTKLAETLLQREIDFRFYCPAKPDETVAWHHRVRKVVSVPFPLYSYYDIALPMFDRLEPELDEFAPEIVHVASPTLLGIFGQDYARRRHIPVVGSFHTNFVSYFRYYNIQFAEQFGWNILRWFYGRCAVVYAPSRSTAADLAAHGIGNVELWQRGIELERFSPHLRDMELRRSIGAEHIPIVLFVARLVKEKDLDDLMAAAELLTSWGHTFKVVFVGDGPYRSEIEQRLPDAYIAGFQYGEDLARWYASADIFAFPSTTETFGNVILEAFASGLPVVTVNKGGVQDLVTSGLNGYIAQANNPLDFAEKIQLLLADEDHRRTLGQNGLKTARNFSWDRINGALIESYQRVIEVHQDASLATETYQPPTGLVDKKKAF
ncbi:MAG: glycosyltransferase family 1 protein [Gemmatimonadetes bacterium]|nr:MAG: glycosyltransferase family 1 protein [Gemmatimonadota bacterium]